MVTFELQDFTGDFHQSTFRAKKYVGEEIKDMDSNIFGADDKVFSYLIENTRYMIYVISDEGESRQLGWITITAVDTEKTITISELLLEERMDIPFDDIDMGFTTDYNASQICLVYNDSSETTNSVSFYVYSSNRTLLYNDTSTSQHVSLCYIVPDQNATYIARAVVDTPKGSTIDIQRTVDLISGIFRKIDFGIAGEEFLGITWEKLYTCAAILFITGAGLLFGVVESGIGVVIMSVSALFFTYIGWLPLSWVILSIMIIISFLSALTRGER